ncbi:MAG: hypothetical protein LW884_09360 [Bacteroidetes bacterium]|jgi:hypothetical protein|nr:hypothetical protein [Bacteroidota bacterium]
MKTPLKKHLAFACLFLLAAAVLSGCTAMQQQFSGGHSCNRPGNHAR